MERWIALGIYPPLAKLDKRGTYLEYLPYDVYNLIPYYLYRSNVDVSFLKIVLQRKEPNAQRIPAREVIQRALNERSECRVERSDIMYPINRIYHLEFRDNYVKLCYRAMDGLEHSCLDLALSLEVAQTLIDAECS